MDVGQVGHICYGTEFTIPTDRILKAFNSKLPRDIRINGALRCAVPVHARFDALWRRYSYTIAQTESVFTRRYAWAVHYPLDDALLHEGARIFLGRHDFTSFSKLNTSTKSYICTVEECHWERHCFRHDTFAYQSRPFCLWHGTFFGGNNGGYWQSQPHGGRSAPCIAMR
jgi:tRNA pseudouridine(38-40) synthase